MNAKGPKLGITRFSFEGDQVRNHRYQVLCPLFDREGKEREAVAALALAAGDSATVSAAADSFAPAHEELGRRGTLPLPASTINRHWRGDSLNHGSSGPWKR